MSRRADPAALPRRITEPTTAYHLLEMVEALALEEPRRVDMGLWYETLVEPGEEITNQFVPTCGTVGCIAGWTLHLVGAPVNEAEEVSDQISDRAANVLGLEYDAAHELFHHRPHDEETGDELMPGTPEYVANVADHLRQFRNDYEDVLKDVVVEPRP